MNKSFNSCLAKAVHDYWDLPAFSDYQGKTYTYAEFGKRIAKMHLLLKAAGVKTGDKVAIIGRNSAGWAMDFFGILTYGAVATPILHDFKPTSIHHIVNHCGAKALFVGNVVEENLDISQMPDLELMARINDLTIIHGDKKLRQYPDLAERLFHHKYPKTFHFENISFHKDKPEELALINYTSGTSGFSKGVMIPYRAIWSNMKFAADNLPFLKPGTNVISILPMAHMYGLAFEVYSEVCLGVHIHFLTRTPSPKVITDSFQQFRPILIVAVPLVIEKIVKKKVFPILRKPKYKVLAHIPVIRDRLMRVICEQLKKALGGEFDEIIIGGAALSPDVEKFLHAIHFPYTVGYGMTECAPLICYAGHDTYLKGSVGRIIDRMEMRIDSSDPEHLVGEIQVKGDNVTLGYYHDEQATRNAFTADGWLRTGDLGTIDKDGNLFIRGRSKNMILGPSGQNIYPEEIEGQLNTRPYVAESLIVAREDKLIALIHPDLELMDSENISSSEVSSIMKQNLEELNVELPAYSKISSFQLFQDEFEKTPKHSIKRYLYN